MKRFLIIMLGALVGCGSFTPHSPIEPNPQIPSSVGIMAPKIYGIEDNRISLPEELVSSQLNSALRSISFEYYSHSQKDSILTIEVGAFDQQNRHILDLTKDPNNMRLFKSAFYEINNRIIAINPKSVTSFSVKEIQDTLPKKWVLILDYSISMTTSV